MRYGIYQKPDKVSLNAFFSLLKPVVTEHKLIRIGSENDGGYLIPEDLENVGAIYSPGVSDNADFELYFAQRGVKCFLLDYSIEVSPVKHSNIYFSKRFLADKNEDHFVTLERWIAEEGTLENNLILQMDIEGAEYEVLKNVNNETLDKFRIIIIEFHYLTHRLDSIINYEQTMALLLKITKKFYVAHVHINNCCKGRKIGNILVPEVIEVTFLRRDRVNRVHNHAKLPHMLDKLNIPSNPKEIIPKIWSK